MLKAEIVIREVLESRKRLTQLELSKLLGFSLSTINNALKPLAEMGAIELKMGIKIVDKHKVLLYWANKRNLQKDIVYRTFVPKEVSEIEKNMPAGIIYTAFSAYKFKFEEVPADYSEVYVYADNIEEIKKRFPLKKGPTNLFVLKLDKRLLEISQQNIAPLSQIFVDLWNIKEWYAKEFIKALEEKIL